MALPGWPINTDPFCNTPLLSATPDTAPLFGGEQGDYSNLVMRALRGGNIGFRISKLDVEGANNGPFR
jgi:hypothetical protein